MKLIRIGPVGHEVPGVISVQGERVNVGAFGEDYDEKFFGSNGVERLRLWLGDASSLPRFGPGDRFGPPIARPSKIICIGLNYADHARESGVALPAEPVIFLKSTTAICGPNDSLVIPHGSMKTDWEVELAFVIGAVARSVSEANALNHVAGYLLHNDYSEREWQLERGGQWVKGKSADTFAPLGPWLATPDEIADVRSLDLWLKVNGEIKQNSSTRNMAFAVPALISYVSRFMTLLPGDVISTGTPPGVGLGHKPPVYLRAGDVVELGVTTLGEQRQEARAVTL
jgi:2,4-diketo-3-deoxy-L-fuconate hydrolase